MNKLTLSRAIDDAKIFLIAAAKLQKLEDKEYFYGSKESGAVKRASMDLTRALAEMRKPG